MLPLSHFAFFMRGVRSPRAMVCASALTTENKAIVTTIFQILLILQNPSINYKDSKKSLLASLNLNISQIGKTFPESVVYFL